MSWTNLGFAAFFCASLCQAFASEVSGRITIEKSAIRRTVPLAVYDLRGMAIPEDASGRRSADEFQRVAIWLESSAPSTAAPVNVKMQQRNRHFEPELLVIPVGSRVDFPNSDPIFHNIFSLSGTQSFDLGYYSEGRSRSVNFPRAGIVQVYCHVHPDMHGVIVVTASRWSGKPAQDGKFSWANVPAGKYRLSVWQKSVGVIHKSVVVPEAGPVHVNVALPEEDPEH
ncbi:MAG: hypothetical protein WB992_08730 [Bryobacteraceae bacterium]